MNGGDGIFSVTENHHQQSSAAYTGREVCTVAFIGLLLVLSANVRRTDLMKRI